MTKFNSKIPPQNNPELNTALDEVRNICQQKKDHGADFIITAAHKDKSTVERLINSLVKAFKQSANQLIHCLETINTLCGNNKDYQAYAYIYAMAVIQDKAIHDYINGRKQTLHHDS